MKNCSGKGTCAVSAVASLPSPQTGQGAYSDDGAAVPAGDGVAVSTIQPQGPVAISVKYEQTSGGNTPMSPAF